MSEFKNTAVQITTFVNPHLFWFIPNDHIKKREALERDFKTHTSNPPVAKKVEPAQSVLVYDKKWKRACVKVASSFGYTCWLIDYGVYYDCDKVYEIPHKYNTEPPLAKQAALSDVVNVKQIFKVDGIEPVQTVKFCTGTIKCAKDRIYDARSVFFHCLTEQHFIHLGKIDILRNDGHLYDLASSLTDDGILALNKELFQEALRQNLETDNFHFFLLSRSFSPCASMTNVKPTESLQETIVKDIAESKGIGRGTSRGAHLKEKRIVPGKTTFVENWLKGSKTASPNGLNYGLDDSENVESSRSVLKSPESAVDVTPFDSVSITDSPRSSFERLKRAATRIKSGQIQNTSATSDSNDQFLNRTADSDDVRSVNSSRELSHASSKLDTTEGWGAKSDTSSTSRDFAISQCSSTVDKGMSSREILKSLLQGQRCSSNPQSSLIVNDKSQVEEDASDTASVNDKYLAMLQKKFESKVRVASEKAQDVEVSSVKSAPSQQNIQWDGSTAGKNTKLLNIMPAGMRQTVPQKKKKTGSSFSSRPSVAESSASSVTSLQKLVAQEMPLPPENGKNAVELLKQNCTQGCTCQQCRQWDADDVDFDDQDFVDTEPKQQKVLVKPPLLLRTEEAKNVVIELKSHTSIVCTATKIERAAGPKILVHGRSLPFPTTSLTAVPFHADIHRALRPFDQVYTIQSYVWPSIMRHINICMVNPPKSGKTMAYLPAICSYLLERQERYEDLPVNTISPIAIILCPGSEAADKVHSLMLKLVNPSPHKPMCVLAVPPVDKICLNQFQKQCDVLVTTPVTLVSLVHARIITVKRLCHLVIENADKILEKFSKEVDSILNLIQSMLEHRNCNLSVQMIVSAEHWTLPLENLMKTLYDTPAVCIGSYLEAALYGRVDIQMQFLEAKSKMFTLTELLKDKATMCKTVVIFNNDSEIEQAKEYLDSAGVNTAYIFDTMDKQEIIDMETKWNHAVGGKYLVLACTDQVYNNILNISNAVMLVHYSLPDTWTQFANRFSSLLDNYISPLATKVPDDWVRCKVHIFVDEGCTKQFPKLVQLLQRMGARLSTKFSEYYKQTIKAREEEKLASKIKLCSNLKLFGKCSSDNRQLCHLSSDTEVAYSLLNCKRRHILSIANDYSTNLPKSGIIKFKIINIQDVNSFTVKILEHTDSEGETHKWKNYENLHKELQEVMSKQKISAFDIKLGGWYALYSEEDKSYSRCTVQKILQIEKITKLASSVTIRCLDTGIEKKMATSFLYELPKKFRTIPAEGVDVMLANMVPPDSDESWSANSKSKVKHTLHEADYQDENVYGIGQILLQLGNVIWVKNILLREKLTMVDTIVTKLNLRRSLQDQNLATYSEEQLQGLYRLCKKAAIELPDFNKLPAAGGELQNKSKEQVEPQWAFFEDCACNEVYIACVNTPSLFYVRLKKFYNLFENLQKEIQDTIAKPFYPSNFEVEVGKYYLAKDFAGDDYCRVKVTEIKENIAECFYVDFGDYASVNVADIKFLTDQLIIKLPFQIIECRLYGVQPAWGGDDWESSAIDILCDFTFEPKTDYYRTLFTTTSKQEPATTTGGQKCAILLVDDFKRDKIILVNQFLIDCGEAVNVENEDLDKEFYIPEVYEEPDDVPDDIEDIENKDLTIEEIKRLATKYKADDKNNNNNKEASDNDGNTNKSESLESNDSVHSWDIEIGDPETFLKQLIGVNITDRPAIEKEPELPPMKALAPANHCTPNIEWYQTENLISINIMLPDLDARNYTIRITRNRMMMFKTIYDGKQYSLELQFYDKIKNSFQYKSYGQYVKVILTKIIPIEWPRLIFASERMRNIKYDLSRLVPDEQEKKTFLQFAGDDEDVKDGECEFYQGSDEDYDESDGESFSSN